MSVACAIISHPSLPLRRKLPANSAMWTSPSSSFSNPSDGSSNVGQSLESGCSSPSSRSSICHSAILSGMIGVIGKPCPRTWRPTSRTNCTRTTIPSGAQLFQGAFFALEQSSSAQRCLCALPNVLDAGILRHHQMQKQCTDKPWSCSGVHCSRCTLR